MVIESCQTIEQLQVAERYAELAGLLGDLVTDAFFVIKYESLKGDGVTEAHCMNKYFNLNA